jgi:hypothetical protein
MTVNKIKNQSTSSPQEIQVRKLSGNLYEFIGHTNITQEVINREDEQVAVYNSDMTHLTVRINSRDEMISALIRLRYTQDAEFAVINKGISNAQDEEYLVYRNYVDLCKQQAKVYYEVRE